MLCEELWMLLRLSRRLRPFSTADVLPNIGSSSLPIPISDFDCAVIYFIILFNICASFRSICHTSTSLGRGTHSRKATATLGNL